LSINAQRKDNAEAQNAHDYQEFGKGKLFEAPISRLFYWLFSMVRSRKESKILVTSSGLGRSVSQRAWKR
jgi:hypothetical protein